MARIKQKGAFELAQDVQIHIILHMRNVSSGSLLSIVHSIVSNDSGSRQRRKALILYAMILIADSDDPDQTARSHSLIWALAVRACPEGTFWLGTAHLFSTTNIKTCLFKYNEILPPKMNIIR